MRLLVGWGACVRLLGSGAHNCEAAGWVGCMCVHWGQKHTSVRLIGWAGCMCVAWGLEQTTMSGWGEVHLAHPAASQLSVPDSI